MVFRSCAGIQSASCSTDFPDENSNGRITVRFTRPEDYVSVKAIRLAGPTGNRVCEECGRRNHFHRTVARQLFAAAHYLFRR
jgi:hypothetical protein